MRIIPALLFLFLAQPLLLSAQPLMLSAQPLVRSVQPPADKFSPAVPLPSAVLAGDRVITRIALGSCFSPGSDPAIFDQIAAAQPDVFIFLGDNVYAENDAWDPELKSLKRSYAGLAQIDNFTRLRQKVPVLPVWDDHDYGVGDGGGDWPGKLHSEALFEHVWAVSSEDPRALRPGIYFERTIGQDGRKVQLILLDTRFFRTPLSKNTARPSDKYMPSPDPNQNLLGEDQWNWFAAQLKKPADLRIIVSTIQVLAVGHAWESWRLLPREKQRLFDLLNDTNAENVIFVSGDRHAAMFYRIEGIMPYPLYELTSSSMNLPLSESIKNIRIEPGPHRVGDPYYDANFGLIDIDWERETVIMKILGEKSNLVQQMTISLATLKH